jgi:phage terminase small subunit
MSLDKTENQQPQEGLPTDETPWYEGLNDRQRRFAEEYCVDFNGTQAAIRAGYSADTARQQAWRMLTNVNISAAIEHLKKQLTMSSEEAAIRLTRMGRGSIEPFLSEEGDLNLTSEAAQANLHLVKKAKTTKRVERIDGVPVADIISTEIELHDAKDAIDKILQYHGKYVKKHEYSGPGGTPIQVEDLSQLSAEELQRLLIELQTKTPHEHPDA